MPVISLDAVWFARNPTRRYRLHRQTAEEWSVWPVPLREGSVAWCIVDGTTGAVTAFGLATGGPLEDDDAAIAALLCHVAMEAA